MNEHKYTEDIYMLMGIIAIIVLLSSVFTASVTALITYLLAGNTTLFNFTIGFIVGIISVKIARFAIVKFNDKSSNDVIA